jgi:hypothetical protein
MATLKRRSEPSGSRSRADASSHNGAFPRFGWRLPTMTIRSVIERDGHFAHGGNSDDSAETWIESGFDADGVEEWLGLGASIPAWPATSPTLE